MKRLSAKSSRKTKKNNAAIFLIFSALILILSAVLFSPEGVLVVSGIIGFHFLIFWKLCWSRVDEVFDDGDTLIVRKGEIEEKILLSNIQSVKFVRGRSAFVKITFFKRGIFGKCIEYSDCPDSTKKSLFRVLQSDGLIALRARIENTTSEALRFKEKRESLPWSLFMVGAFVLFVVVNYPTGTVENVTCTVLDVTITSKQKILLTLQINNDSKIKVVSDQRPAIGSTIRCTRQKHSITRDFSYQC